MPVSRFGIFSARVLASIGLLVVLPALLAAAALLFSDRWRQAADLPEESDAIVVLAGSPQRPLYAADLFRQGYGPVVYLGRPAEESLPPEVDVNRAILLQGGVPDHAIRVFARPAVNTLDEAHSALAALPVSVKSVLVVTSPVHTRRARMIFNDVFAARGTKFTVVANPYEPRPAHWWSEHWYAKRTVVELAKAVLYSLGIRYSHWPAQEAEAAA